MVMTKRVRGSMQMYGGGGNTMQMTMTMCEACEDDRICDCENEEAVEKKSSVYH